MHLLSNLQPSVCQKYSPHLSINTLIQSLKVIRLSRKPFILTHRGPPIGNASDSIMPYRPHETHSYDIKHHRSDEHVVQFVVIIGQNVQQRAFAAVLRKNTNVAWIC